MQTVPHQAKPGSGAGVGEATGVGVVGVPVTVAEDVGDVVTDGEGDGASVAAGDGVVAGVLTIVDPPLLRFGPAVFPL